MDVLVVRSPMYKEIKDGLTKCDAYDGDKWWLKTIKAL